MALSQHCFPIAAFGNEATGDAEAALNPMCNRGEGNFSLKPFQWIRYPCRAGLVLSTYIIMRFPSALAHSRVTVTIYGIRTPTVCIHNHKYLSAITDGSIRLRQKNPDSFRLLDRTAGSLSDVTHTYRLHLSIPLISPMCSGA